MLFCFAFIFLTGMQTSHIPDGAVMFSRRGTETADSGLAMSLSFLFMY